MISSAAREMSGTRNRTCSSLSLALSAPLSCFRHFITAPSANSRSPLDEKISRRFQSRPPEHLRLSVELFSSRRLRADSSGGDRFPLARSLQRARRRHARLHLRLDDLLLPAHDR